MDTSEASVRTTVSYEETERKLLEFLSKKDNEVMVLSTSADGVVTSRNVLVANDGLRLYFFTWAYSRKCMQIAKNERVSLCKDKVEIEGSARLVGPMFAPETSTILSLFRSKEPDAIMQWEHSLSMVIYNVAPVFASVDGCIKNGEAVIERIDFQKRIAYREKWAYR